MKNHTESMTLYAFFCFLSLFQEYQVECILAPASNCDGPFVQNTTICVNNNILKTNKKLGNQIREEQETAQNSNGIFTDPEREMELLTQESHEITQIQEIVWVFM